MPLKVNPQLQYGINKSNSNNISKGEGQQKVVASSISNNGSVNTSDPVVNMNVSKKAITKLSEHRKNGMGVANHSASSPINKTAQFMGGDNVAWSQPSFFSPIHTPQNWQIPSRRREVYQWAFLPEAKILTADYTYKNIDELKFYCEKEIIDNKTGGSLFEDIKSEPIIDSKGKLKNPIHFSQRSCNNKKCYSIKAKGNDYKLPVSEEHNIFVYNFKTDSVERKEIRNVNNIDCLLTPVPDHGKFSLNEEKIFLLKFFVDNVKYIKQINTQNGLYEYKIFFNTEMKDVSYFSSLLEELFSARVIFDKDGSLDYIRLFLKSEGFFSFYYFHFNFNDGDIKFTENIFEFDRVSKIKLFKELWGGKELEEEKKTIIENSSKNIILQLYWLALSCGFVCDVEENKLIINSYNCDKYFIEKENVKYFVQPIESIDSFSYSGKLYDLQIEPERAFVASGYIASNCRFFYYNEPKAAAGIEFYRDFPMTDFSLEFSNRDKTRKYFFEDFIEKIKLDEVLADISHEYFLLGDVFPFKEIECEHCFLEDTVVFTESGYKNIQDIEIGENVLTLEKNKKPVINKFARKYDGYITSIKTPLFPNFVSTEDHKHYVVSRKNINKIKNKEKLSTKYINKVAAKEIKNGDFLLSPFNVNLEEKKQEIEFTDINNVLYNIEVTESFVKLLGIILTNVNFEDVNGLLPLYIQKDYTDFVKQELIDNFNIRISKFSENNDYDYLVGYSILCCDWLNNIFNKGNSLPDFIMKSPKHIKETFIKSCLGEDEKICVENKTLCYDFVILLSSLGNICSVEEDDGQFIISINSISNGIFFNDDFIYSEVTEISSHMKNTVVYNIKVEDDHNYIADNFHTKNCGGTGRLPDGNECLHSGGSFKNIKILNPDYITVKENELTDEKQILLTPDDQLKTSVQELMAKNDNNNSAHSKVLQMLATGGPIPLSNKCCSHIRHHGSKYGTYGTPMLQRLFTTLAYKTKLITANWIIADRLILPIRIFKVGTDERPAAQTDINQLTAQITSVANNPQQTLVTHHAVDVEWVGAAGNIYNITQEMDQIGKEILDGLMLNQALLNGEMGSYSSAQVGIETLIRRLEQWRNKLKKWVERELFLPLAKMNNFIDKEKTEKLGKTVYDYPSFVWEELNLRDNSNKIQTYIQMHDKGLVSADTLLSELGLDYDIEQSKLREESVQTDAQGGMLGGGMLGGGAGGAMGGGLGDLGGLGGGAGGGLGDLGMDMGGGAAEGVEMGGAPGGDMDMTGGGMPDMGGGGAAGGEMGASAQLPKITKEKKDKSFQQPQNKTVRLTSLEQRVLQVLKTIDINDKLFIHFRVNTNYSPQPYEIDFAYPRLKLAIEADGDKWHKDPDSKSRDIARDENLASLGWTVQRVSEDLIEEDPSVMRDLIIKTILQLNKKNSKKEKNKNK